VADGITTGTGLQSHINIKQIPGKAFCTTFNQPLHGRRLPPATDNLQATLQRVGCKPPANKSTRACDQNTHNHSLFFLSLFAVPKHTPARLLALRPLSR
jgi:hypothetical protein